MNLNTKIQFFSSLLMEEIGKLKVLKEALIEPTEDTKMSLASLYQEISTLFQLNSDSPDNIKVSSPLSLTDHTHGEHFHSGAEQKEDKNGFVEVVYPKYYRLEGHPTCTVLVNRQGLFKRTDKGVFISVYNASVSGYPGKNISRVGIPWSGTSNGRRYRYRGIPACTLLKYTFGTEEERELIDAYATRAIIYNDGDSTNIALDNLSVDFTKGEGPDKKQKRPHYKATEDKFDQEIGHQLTSLVSDYIEEKNISAMTLSLKRENGYLVQSSKSLFYPIDLPKDTGTKLITLLDKEVSRKIESGTDVEIVIMYSSLEGNVSTLSLSIAGKPVESFTL